MSEANILNPSAASLLNFDYGYKDSGLPEMRSVFQAQSGKVYSRQQLGRGRVLDLSWGGRDKATMHTLRQWDLQYRNDFFTLVDWERSRYYSGRFEGPLEISPAGNEKWNIQGRFIELPSLPLNTYPSDWARDAIFLEERNGFGEDLVKLTGSWAYSAHASAHGGFHYFSNITNDFVEWLYFGYGFRYWAGKFPDAGIFEYTVTRVRDGTVVAGPANIDQYSTGTAAAVLLTVTNLALDLYRVKLRVTGTKNVSSSSFYLYADAIEVMQ
ncbi:MAG: hypothetical protein ACREUQ_09560 [Burkholderiales bacterium]